MKQLLTIIALALVSSISAQTFNTITPSTACDADINGLNVDFNVTGLPVGGLSTAGTVLRQVDIQLGTSSCTGNLSSYQLTLTNPQGVTITLTSQLMTTSTGSWVDMSFRDDIALERLNEYTSFTQWDNTPHDAGYYAIENDGEFSNFHTGFDPNGTWTITITEGTSFEVSFESATLIFGPDVNVNDVTLCADNNFCSGASCISDGVFRGNNNGYSQNDPQYPGNIVDGCDWNGSNNNSAWFTFVPTATTVSMNISGLLAVTPGSFDSQPIVLEANGNCGTPVNVVNGGCPNDDPYYTNGTSDNVQFDLTGLTIGNTYYLYVDGNGGVSSYFYIEIESGVNNTCPTGCCNIIIAGDDEACEGGGDISYTQTGGIGGGTWTVLPATAGTINPSTGVFTPSGSVASTINATVTYDDGSCTSDYGVTVSPLPTATVSGGGSYCAGGTVPDVIITLTGTGPWDFTYTDGVTPVNVTGQATSPYTISGGGDGTYTVTALNDANCTGTTFNGSATITTNPLPTATVSGGGTICSGDLIPDVIITLTGTGPWDFTYTDGVTPVNVTGQATSPYTISGGGDGTYTVTALNDVNCTGTTFNGSATITTNPLPTATVSGGGSYCAGGTIPDVIITLTGTGPWDFTYTDGVTPVNVTGQATSPYTISGGGDGTYTVTALNDANCTGTTFNGSATITTNPLPTATVSGGGSYCAGGTIPDVIITLTGTGPWDFTYTDGITPVNVTGQATSPYTISGGGDGTYTVTALNDANCTGTTFNGSATITTNPLPTATVSGGGSYCAGATVPDVIITLTGTGPWDFTYTDGVTPVNVTGQATSPYTISGGGDGTYTVTALNDANCTGTTFNGSATITTNPLPTATVSGGGSYCAGGTIPDVIITLTGTGPWDFTYTDGVTPVNVTGQATSPYTISGGGDGTYTVTALNDANCTGTTFNGSATITTNPLPTATVSGGGSYCAGGTIPDVIITLTGTGPWDFTYTDGVTPVNVTGQATSPYTISGGGDGTYTVTALNDANCTGTTFNGSATITTNPLPTATVSGGGSYCAGATVPDVIITLTGTGPWDFTYTDGVTPVNVTGQATSPYTISGGGDGTYTVTALNDANCTGTTFNGSATITTNPLPTATVSGGGSYCAGGTIPDVIITLTGTGPWDFTYTDGVTPVNVTGQATSPYTISGGGDGTYTVTALNDANCTGTTFNGAAIITTNPLPTATVSGGGTICSGGTIPDVIITLTGTGPWDFTYTDGITPVNVTGQATSPYTISGGGDGTYTVTALNDANCTGITFNGSATITTNPTPVAPTAGTDATYCFGEPMADLFAAGGGGVLTWYDSAPLSNVIGTGTSLTPSGAIGIITYYVTETLAGCEGPASMITTTVYDNPSIDIEANTDVSNCGATDGTITITVSGGTGAYQWQINGGGYVAGASPYTFTGLGVNTYVIDVFDGNCYDQSTTITVSNPAIPAAPVAGTDAAYCEGDPMIDMTATAGSGGTLTWYDDGALTNVVGSGTTLSPIAQNGTTVYYVTETVAGCESPSTQITITINALPVAPVAGTSATYCDGNPISDLTATAGSGGTLNWYNDAGLTNNVGSGAVLSPNPAVGNYTYYVTETVVGCEGPATAITIDINPTPSFAVSATDPTTCGGTEGTITISGLTPSTAYDITYSDNGTTVGPTSMNSDPSGDVVITGLDAGTYDNITVSILGCGTVDPGVYTLTDPNAPVYTVATTSPTSCGGTDGTITISGLTPSTAYDISYTDNGTVVGPTSMNSDPSGDVIITGLDAGTYDNIIVSIFSCSTADPVVYTLTDPNGPLYTIATSNPTTCGGTDGSITISGLTPAMSYNVAYDDDGTTVGPTAIVTDGAGEIVIAGLNAGTYANITIENLGCATTEVGPYVLTDPSATVAPNAGTDSTYCTGQTLVDLTVSGTGGTYNWYDDVTLVNNIGAGSTITPGSTVGTTTYYVTETIAGCESLADSVVITVVALPSVPIVTTDTIYCPGDVIVDVTATGTGGIINWYDDASLTNNVGTGSTYTPSAAPGTQVLYVVEVDTNGCVSLADSVTIHVSSGPIASFSPTPSSGNVPLDVYFDNTSMGGVSYSWDLGDNNTSTDFDPNYIYTVVGDYTVWLVAYDSLGCTDTTSVIITVEGESVLIIPNVFTPNGDGVNDVFTPSGTNITDVTGAIYNRWGQLIYSWNGLLTGWDGRTVAGSLASEGTYYYIIEAQGADGEVHHAEGPLLLAR